MKMLVLTIALVALLSPADVLADNEPPGMPLPLAVLTGDIAAVEQHIEAGTDLNQRDDFGSSPLIIAAVFDRPKVAAALLEADADAMLRDAQGSNPLHIAAFLGRTEVARSLLDAGVDRYARSASGAMAFDYAAAPLPEERAIFDVLRNQLAPIGFRLDDAEVAAARPVIARMLRPSAEDLDDVTYAPVERAGFPVSTPEAEGLDPTLVAELYRDAEALPRLFSILVVKNGKLVAEKYFNGGDIDRPSLMQSVVKSYFSAFVGVAHERGCLPDLDQAVIDYFPEYAGQITDPRKSGMTIRHLLQMRSGLPWEESDPVLWDRLINEDNLKLLAEYALVNDPGSAFNYSNLSTRLLGVIVERACDADLMTFAEDAIIRPIGGTLGNWPRDPQGQYHPVLEATARTNAKFGLLYLDGGIADGKQVLPKDWVDASLTSYSDDAWVTLERLTRAGRYFRDLAYGYQWWQAKVGDRRVDFAWGHGGQLIVLVDDLDMVLVVTAYPAWLEHDQENWSHERSHLNLAGKFISLLP
ncbi:serine hydrolase [Marimonas arenosa]|uniref:Serine hydrolase n=1 Tax=Marimonas arenosa TaxID=1795305 RepID=A0AAE4B580_9RHOB|nr:serine hydrolase [Marimonas arenosa]MDQ2091788.1 serine hydrolase [Marimonas arenosa]